MLDVLVAKQNAAIGMSVYSGAELGVGGINSTLIRNVKF